MEEEDGPTLRLHGPQEHELAVFESARARLFAGDSGVQVSRYKLLRQVGRGGFGSVFEAHDPELDRLVAIKLLHASHSIDGPSADSLHREAKLLARFRHPNVVSVYDVGRYDQEASSELRAAYPHVAPAGVFLVMELVEGLTLSEWLRSPRSWRDILDVFQMAGRALADAHAHGIVHRDFKPGNVMVESDGNVRVGDFGLSEGIADATPSDGAAGSGRASGSDAPRARSVFGTTAFMAPELFTAAHFDERVDQFAFGVSLHLALTGELPARPDASTDPSAKAQRTRRPRGPGPRSLWRAIERMTAAEPTARFPSMRDALAAIDTRRGQRRRRAAVAVVGASGIVAFAALTREQPRTVDCAHEASVVDALWSERSPAFEAAFELSIARGDVDPSERDLARVHIGRFLDDWRWARRASCESFVTFQRQEEDIEATCLDDVLADFSGITAGLVLSDGGVSPRAADIAAELPVVAQCIGADSVGLRVTDTAPAAERSAMRGELARYDVLLAEDPRLVLTSVERLQTRLSRLPSLQAKADLLTADATWLMGDVEAAIQLYVDVYLLASRDGLHADALDAAAILSSYLTASLGRSGEGRIWAQLANAAFEAAGSPAHELATMEELRAITAQGEGRAADAAEHLERTLLLELARPPIARERALHLLDSLAQNAQDYDPADALLFATAVRNYARTAWPRRVPLHASIESNYIDALRTAGFDRAANAAIRLLLPEIDELLGPNHPVAAKLRMQLALVEREAGRSDLAEPLVTEAITALEHALGPASPLVRRAQIVDWLLLVDRGELDEAERLVTAALQEMSSAADNDELLADLYEVRTAARYLVNDVDGAMLASERAIALSSGVRSRAKMLHDFAAWSLLHDDLGRARDLLSRTDLRAVAGADLANARHLVLSYALTQPAPDAVRAEQERSVLVAAWKTLDGMDVMFATLAEQEIARRSVGREAREWTRRCSADPGTPEPEMVRLARRRCAPLRPHSTSSERR